MNRKAILMLVIAVAIALAMMPEQAHAQEEYTVHAQVWDPDPQVEVAYDCEDLEVRIKGKYTAWSNWQYTDEDGIAVFEVDDIFVDYWEIEWRVTTTTNPMPFDNDGHEGPIAPLIQTHNFILEPEI